MSVSVCMHALSLENFVSNIYAHPKKQKVKLLANIKQILGSITVKIERK